MDLGYRPLVYMWIAEFSDGSALPQFNPETGRENRGDPDWLPSKGKPFKLPDDPLNPEKLIESLKGAELIGAERPRIFLEKKLCRFGWYPFSVEFAAKVPVLVVPTRNPLYGIELKEGDKLVASRRNHVEINLRGGVRRGGTVYLLGVEGGEVMEIREDGRLISKGAPDQMKKPFRESS